MNYRKQLMNRLAIGGKNPKKYNQSHVMAYFEANYKSACYVYNSFLNNGCDGFSQNQPKHTKMGIILNFLKEKKFKKYFINELKRQLSPECSRQRAYLFYNRFIETGLKGIDNNKFLRGIYLRKNNYWFSTAKSVRKNCNIHWNSMPQIKKKEDHGRMIGYISYHMNNKTFRQGIKDIIDNFFNKEDKNE